MARSRSSGMSGLGLFGTSSLCASTDNSILCSIMKLFNLLTILFLSYYMIWFLYIQFSPTLKKIKIFKK